jgi:tetratricopeptide (TPR) repeat protein
VLHVPAGLLWFATSHASEEFGRSSDTATLDDVRRREIFKAAGVAIVAGSGLLNDAPWLRLAECRAGLRAADASTVTTIESDTAAFFRSEETMPARELVTSLKTHRQSLVGMIKATSDETLRRRLTAAVGQTEALTGWTLFDLKRPREAVQFYVDAMGSAKLAGDNALAACVLGYWSYLHSAQDRPAEAAGMLKEASERIRGSAAATQAWVTARLAEEQASLLESGNALRSLDKAITVYDYANPMTERPWTCFFTPSRLGGLAVSTYGKMAHRDTNEAAMTLLASLPPTENKVKTLVLADLAMSAARSGEFDRAQAFAEQSIPLAIHTEASLAIDRLWELVELLPEGDVGAPGQMRETLTARLLATSKN